MLRLSRAIQFNSLNDLHEVAEKHWDDLQTYTGKLRRKEQERNWSTDLSESWYGTTDLSELEGHISDFIDINAINEASELVKNIVNGIDFGDEYKQDRIKPSSLERGIFSFDLAAQGLVRVYEYYDPVAKVVVDAKRVTTIEDKDGQTMFFLRIFADGKIKEERQLEQRQKLHMVDGEMKPKFASTVKKTYLLREKTPQDKKVDLYLQIGGHNKYQADDLVWRAIPVMLAAELMEKSGIKTRINGTSLSYNRPTKEITAFSAVLKGYDDPLDINQVLLGIADPRIFRYKIFKATIGFFDMWNMKQHRNLGIPLTEEIALQLFEDYKDWHIENVNPDEKRENMIYQSYDIDYKKTKKLRRESPSRLRDYYKDRTKAEFVRLVDKIDVNFNGAKNLRQIMERQKNIFGRVKFDTKDYINNQIMGELEIVKDRNDIQNQALKEWRNVFDANKNVF